MPIRSMTTRRRSEATRDSIRAAATQLFSEHGYSATSVRDIASRAGADPALVVRYFGGKERLFLETMAVHGALARVTEGDLDTLGARILEHLLLSPGARSVFTAVMRAADHPDIRAYLAEANEANLVGPLGRRLRGPGARERAALIAAQVNGLLHELWTIEEPTLNAMPVERLIEVYAPLLQQLIEPPAPRSAQLPAVVD